MNNREATKQIENILDKQCSESYKNGIADGLRVAERIFLYYSTNHKLVNPETMEQLGIWSKNDLEHLRNKLK